jgi:23S rRNA (adenine2503-C2)-methyltransferase
MEHFLDTPMSQLSTWLTSHAQPSFRAGQIWQWLAKTRVQSWDEMTDLPQGLRQQLTAEFALWSSTIVAHRTSDDGTEKLLLQWSDGKQVECVLLRDGIRRTICISTQVGCAMGCVFCASGIGGVVRNLTTGEIIEQMLRLTRLLPAAERLSHIVVMGMGEPLANLDRLILALDWAAQPKGLGISHRRITISTVGLPPALDRLRELERHYQLAVSLHAPNDQLRSQLVPVNKSTGLEAILRAADAYFESSGRRLTFEYVLLADINDRVEHARELAALLKNRLALLNVIPYNPVQGLPYRTPSGKSQERFLEILAQANINVQVRERKGDAIDAACGQLRRDYLSEQPLPVITTQ